MDGPPPPYTRLINEESPEESCTYSHPALTSPQDASSNPPSYEYSVGQGSNSSQPTTVQQQYSTSVGSNEQSPRNTDEHPRPDVIVQRSVLVLVVNGSESERQTKSYCGHIWFSCLAIWLCGIYGGIRAFVYAIKARRLSQQGRDVEAEVYGQASIGNSIAGVVMGIIVIAIFVGVFLFVTKGGGGSGSGSGHSPTVATANNIFFQSSDGSCCYQNDNPCTYYKYMGTYYTC